MTFSPSTRIGTLSWPLKAIAALSLIRTGLNFGLEALVRQSETAAPRKLAVALVAAAAEFVQDQGH